MNGTPIPSRRSILALGDDQIGAICAAASQTHDTLPSLREALAEQLGDDNR